MWVLAQSTKCPCRGTLHTVVYHKHDAYQDEDGQQRTDIVSLSDNSCDEYQNSDLSNDTELDMEPDTHENDSPDGTRSVTHHQSRTKEKGINKRVSTV